MFGFDKLERKVITFVGLGEVLFDVFGDGVETLGGAPLNVAVHAHRLASALGVGEGVVASRVGSDERGERILEALAERDMSREFVQVDATHETGKVSVSMRDGEPEYRIEPGVAWDFLEWTAGLERLAEGCDAVCFGTLAQRSGPSRETIRRFVSKAARAVRLFDVNLRQAFYSAEVIAESARLATMMKVNGGELGVLCRMFGIADGSAAGLLRAFPVSALVVTEGARGTRMFTGDGEFAATQPPAAIETVYPVGAGDACSAGILFGAAMGWRPERSVELADRMGAFVASRLSATPVLPDSIVEFARDPAQTDAGRGSAMAQFGNGSFADRNKSAALKMPYVNP